MARPNYGFEKRQKELAKKKKKEEKRLRKLARKEAQALENSESTPGDSESEDEEETSF